MSEAAWQRVVSEYARWRGYLVYHTHDSRRSAAGFPDLVLARPGYPIIIAELKREHGTLQPDQAQWLEVLGRVPGIVTGVWRPGDWELVQQIIDADQHCH